MPGDGNIVSYFSGGEQWFRRKNGKKAGSASRSRLLFHGNKLAVLHDQEICRDGDLKPIGGISDRLACVNVCLVGCAIRKSPRQNRGPFGNCFFCAEAAANLWSDMGQLLGLFGMKLLKFDDNRVINYFDRSFCRPARHIFDFGQGA